MKTAIRKMGNSHGVIIPKPLLAEIGVTAGDPVELNVKKGKLVMEPLRQDPRGAWAEECKAIREAGEDGLAWPEFPNKDDDKLVW